MKQIETSDSLPIPDNVTVTIKSRVVTVKGERGSLTRSFKHLNLDMKVEGKAHKKFVVNVFFANRKQIACIKTIISHVKNMITGVTKGFEYKMRLVYAHFPINVTTVNDGDVLEIRNFLGEKIVRKVTMLQGVKIERSEKVKDELVLVGNDLELVSQSGTKTRPFSQCTAANVHQACLVKNKDIRKFLDGIYVSEKRTLGDD